MAKRIIIAGGGTGGHIFPAVAIANALRKEDPSVQILFVGASGKMEMEKVPQAGYEIKGLDIVGFNRSAPLKNVFLPFRIIKSLVQVSTIMKQFPADAVVGVGGYSTFPVLRYAQSRGIPTFIHESNSHAGKTNMMLAKKAIRIFTGTDGMEKFFPPGKIMVTGNPVRKSLSELLPDRDTAVRFFGLQAGRMTVLITGGSLGAKNINEAVAEHISEFSPNDLQLIWQTGKPFADQAAQASAGRKNVWTGAFIDKMEMAYAAADIVISRSGAMAVAELCIVGKPVIFVPFPFAAEDHQTVNAKRLSDRGAALLVTDGAVKEQLIPTLIGLSKDIDRQQQLQIEISKLAITQADQVIAKEILNTIS